MAEREPIYRYTVIPDEKGQFITVHADLKLQGSVPYLKDFGQMESIHWFVGDREISVKSRRIGDIISFSDLPARGEVKVIYRLKCVTESRPGYRKRLMGFSNFVLVREGLFLGIEGLASKFVDISWRLPSGWTLVLGGEGLQRFVETQKTLWVAGKTAQLTEEKVGDKFFRIGIIEGVYDVDLTDAITTLKSIFNKAWNDCGQLDAKNFGIAVVPSKSIGGGTSLGFTIISENNWITIVHEMLHWWTNRHSPAWFREGVHTYISAKILTRLGLLSQDQFDSFLQECLNEHNEVVEREGELNTLAESSDNYDNRKGGGDIYGLMPVFAYKLDREIHSYNPGANLDLVFAAVCQKRHQKLDILALIKEITGYDPGPLFEKYFYSRVQDVSGLLK
ncbi:MAG: hypothetical protein OEY25_02055 [Candidatus Aminicenantes bacterium]|nr:hypothetical protein [Candidatus Aminicenantes bacterium]MDH5705062.1 hypothetical protein [Candidatus Aminicenantes bacterium]